MRVAIIGNSGSGKSTLAKSRAGSSVPVLDLDTIAWEPNVVAVARPADLALADLEAFCTRHDEWIVEGCYADLISATLRFGPELIFLNPGEAVCLQHCRERPWEPHKYASKAEQDAKLGFLLPWVSDYFVREGPMSLKVHAALFKAYQGPKREVTVALELPLSAVPPTR